MNPQEAQMFQLFPLALEHSLHLWNYVNITM